MGSEHQRKKNRAGNRDRKNHGFSVVEVLVSIFIIALLSVQILGFSGLKEAASLNRAAQELGFAIRRAQSMALAVTRLEIGGIMQTPLSVGIRLSSSPALDPLSDPPFSLAFNREYIFFADQDRDRMYETAERIEPNLVLPGGIFMKAITLSDSSAISTAHIIFTTPEAFMLLTDANGILVVGTQINVILQGRSGATRTIEIHTSGQVTITNP